MRTYAAIICVLLTVVLSQAAAHAGCGDFLARRTSVSREEPALQRRLLSIVRLRVLDSDIGRWTRRDPAGYLDGASLVGYASDKPTLNLDSFGLVCGGTVSACSGGSGAGSGCLDAGSFTGCASCCLATWPASLTPLCIAQCLDRYIPDTGPFEASRCAAQTSTEADCNLCCGLNYPPGTYDFEMCSLACARKWLPKEPTGTDCERLGLISARADRLLPRDCPGAATAEECQDCCEYNLLLEELKAAAEYAWHVCECSIGGADAGCIKRWADRKKARNDAAGAAWSACYLKCNVLPSGGH